MTLVFSTRSAECPPCADPMLNHGRSDVKKRGKDHQVPSQGQIQLTVLLKVILSSTHLGSIYLADTWIGPCKDLLWKLKLLCEHSNAPPQGTQTLLRQRVLIPTRVCSRVCLSLECLCATRTFLTQLCIPCNSAWCTEGT